MNWKIEFNCPGNSRKMRMVLFLFCFFPLILFGKNKEFKHVDPSPEAWEQIAPYLIPEDHPVKQTLDTLFSQSRILQDRDSLIKAGFVGAKSRPDHKVIVTRHTQMPGYIFKMFTDDRLAYSYSRPEYVLWVRRATGAELVRREIAKQGWQAYFKSPIKWIYALPATHKAKSGHLQKDFILVEEDMEILPRIEGKMRWRDGTITPQHLHMLFHLLSTIGMYDSGAPCNIPICKDGRIAFIDTQSYLRWPPNYHRLYSVLNDEMATVWKRLIKEGKKQKHSKKKIRRAAVSVINSVPLPVAFQPEGVLYRNNMKNRFLAASALPRNSDAHSRLAYRQWSLAPHQNSGEPPCQKTDSSCCFGITFQSVLKGLFVPRGS